MSRDQSENELFRVEKIVGKRVKAGKLEYRVKWEGYSMKESTWEITKNLKHVKQLIKEFEQAEKDKGKAQAVRSRFMREVQSLEGEKEDEDEVKSIPHSQFATSAKKTSSKSRVTRQSTAKGRQRTRPRKNDPSAKSVPDDIFQDVDDSPEENVRQFEEEEEELEEDEFMVPPEDIAVEIPAMSAPRKTTTKNSQIQGWKKYIEDSLRRSQPRPIKIRVLQMEEGDTSANRSYLVDDEGKLTVHTSFEMILNYPLEFVVYLQKRKYE